MLIGGIVFSCFLVFLLKFTYEMSPPISLHRLAKIPEIAEIAIPAGPGHSTLTPGATHRDSGGNGCDWLLTDGLDGLDGLDGSFDVIIDRCS